LEWPELNTIIQTPWWLWIGGALGAFYVFCTIFLAPKLGGATLIGLVISGQMIVSLILDHYGFLGFAQQPINIWRILGVFLLLIGVILIKIN
jgi:transporter family-2 protein